MTLSNAIEPPIPSGYKILTIGHESLRKPSQDVSEDSLGSENLHQLIEGMRLTLKAHPGVGLAAPQVGVNFNIFITRVPKSCAERYLLCKETPLQTWINPRYEVLDTAELICGESCLSVPGYVGKVSRPREIEVIALDETGREFSEKLVGWNARVFLHEYDHLTGRIYIDKVLSDERGNKEIYKEEVWKDLTERKKKEGDHHWLERHNLRS